MTNELPHDIDSVRAEMNLRVRIDALHRELASYYRTKSKDRKTIANLWFAIERLEAELELLLLAEIISYDVGGTE